MNILATSGGFQASGRGMFEWEVGPIIRHALELSGAERPRICYVGTATGDSVNGTAAALAAFSRAGLRGSHLALFTMPNVDDLRGHVLEQDVVWVGGGSVANLLAVWRVHGLDVVMREAWGAGVVLGGVSAGSLCWHVGGTTDSFGPTLRAVTNGLAMLPYSNTPHYDSEAERRPLYQRLVANGTLPGGWATDDGVGLHFRGTELVEAVSDRPRAYAWRVQPLPDGVSVETRVDPRRLPD